MTRATTPESDADPLAMRALAHPARIKLMMALGNGPANVSMLASEVGLRGNQVSFHLRQLEKYGLVHKTERPKTATARESWWMLAADTLRVRDLGVGRTEEQRMELAGVVAALYQNRAAVVADGLLAGGAEDAGAGGRNQVLEARLRLTEAEADDLAAEVRALWAKWSERDSPSPQGNDTFLFAIDLFQTTTPRTT